MESNLRYEILSSIKTLFEVVLVHLIFLCNFSRQKVLTNQ